MRNFGTVRGNEVIDRLETVMHPEIPLTKQIESGLHCARKVRSKLYQEGFDVQALGIPGILFRRCRFNRTQKLVLKGVAKMTLPQMANLIAGVFDSDPWESRLARVDFAIDVHGIPIEWFRAHVRVRGKQRYKEHPAPEQPMGNATGMTLYMGGRHDLFRFYDKSAQLVARFGPRVGRVDRSAKDDVPTTRIERQLRTSAIPTAISTLEGLRINASQFDPFKSVSFAPGGTSEPQIRNYPIRAYLEGAGLRALIGRWGLAETWKIINKRSGGNASRTFSRLADFIPSNPQGLAVPNLLDLHRSSTSHQLGGASNRIHLERDGHDFIEINSDLCSFESIH